MRVARWLGLLLLAGVVIAVLFEVVFPRVDAWLDDPAVEAGAATALTA